MNIIDEYLHQQTWRHWDQYLKHIPPDKHDRIIDLGCSVSELNFDGPASPQVLRNWKARCERLVMLRNIFPDFYTDICADIIAGLQSHKHMKANNVQFVVAQKKL